MRLKWFVFLAVVTVISAILPSDEQEEETETEDSEIISAIRRAEFKAVMQKSRLKTYIQKVGLPEEDIEELIQKGRFV